LACLAPDFSQLFVSCLSEASDAARRTHGMNLASMVTSEGDLSPELENMPVTDTCNDIRYVQSNIYLLFLPQNQFHSYACNSNISSLRSLCLYSNPSQVAKPALIDTNETKVGEFQSAINVTPNAYTRFRGQNGPDKGAESSVYLAAWAFFKQRELRGIKLPSTSAKKGEKESVPSVDGIV
jgi:hypothetical protein